MCNFLQNIPIEIYAVFLWWLTTITSLVIWFHLWKKQIKTQKSYEATLDFIEAVVRYHEAIRYVRHIWMPVSEYWPYIDDSSKWYFKWVSYAYEKRWEKIKDARVNLSDKKIVFELVTWLNLNENLRNIYDKQWALLVHLQTHLDWLRWERDSKYEHDIVFWVSDDNDTFDQEIKSQVEQIKTNLKPYLLQ